MAGTIVSGLAKAAAMYEPSADTGGGGDIIGTSNDPSTNTWAWDGSNPNYSEFG